MSKIQGTAGQHPVLIRVGMCAVAGYLAMCVWAVIALTQSWPLETTFLLTWAGVATALTGAHVYFTMRTVLTRRC